MSTRALFYMNDNLYGILHSDGAPTSLGSDFLNISTEKEYKKILSVMCDRYFPDGDGEEFYSIVDYAYKFEDNSVYVKHWNGDYELGKNILN